VSDVIQPAQAIKAV
jgi:hypothetical protein